MSDFSFDMSDSNSVDSSTEYIDHPRIPNYCVKTKEERSLKLLWWLMDQHAPHLRKSFIFSESWWEVHWGTPEAHMFKYLLFRGMEDFMVIFDSGQAVEPSKISKLLKRANDSAELIWEDEDIPFSTRVIRCEEILDPVVNQNLMHSGPVMEVPETIVSELGRLFRKFYNKTSDLLLIGQTHERAYEVQDKYAREVAEILGAVDARHKSRAITRLQKVYGRGSMPLLCVSSVSGLWRLCRSPFYRKQTALLYRWIEPFAEMRSMHRLGCDYVSSIHRFLRPDVVNRNSLFKEFYASLMMWSTDFYSVALLDAYVAPTPVVADFVREQLLQEEERREILRAIRDKKERRDSTNTLYDVWLSYAGLDFNRQGPAINDVIKRGLLTRALFDLALGQSVKSFMMSRYTEIHSVRAMFLFFFDKWKDLISPAPDPQRLWWDGVYDGRVPDQRLWLPIELKNDTTFLLVLESWLSDGESLQSWLDSMEAETPLVNNPGDVCQVFSESVAVEIMKWAKFQGDFFDRRRRAAFNYAPRELREEYERLGIFTTRMPRFTQVYFYDFTDKEAQQEVGQPSSGSVSRRAAEAYLRSGVRLESSCGISGIWYSYVEKNRDLYTDRTASPPLIEQGPEHPRPRVYADDARFMWSIFRWSNIHGRPQLEQAEQTPTAASSPVNGGLSQDRPSGEFIDEVTSGPAATPQQKEGISEYTEAGVGDSREVLSDGEERGTAGKDTRHDASLVETGEGRVKEEPACHTVVLANHISQEKGGMGGGPEGEKDEFDDMVFDQWPMSASFDEALSKALNELTGVPEIPYVVTDTFVPSSIPEEREFSRDPALMGLTHGLGGAGPSTRVKDPLETIEEDPMEGVEASQPTEVRVLTTGAGSPHSELAAGEDEEVMDSEDGEHTADAYTMAAHRPTKAERARGLAELVERRKAKRRQLNAGRP